MAISSRPPSIPAIPVDRLKQLGGIALFLLVSGGAVYKYDDLIVKEQDLKVHVGEAHMITVGEDEHGNDVRKPMTKVVESHEKAIAQLPAMKAAIDDANRNSRIVKNGFFDERASRLGSRAANSMPPGTHWKRRKIKADQVKRTALNNLNADRPIDVGIEQYAF